VVDSIGRDESERKGETNSQGFKTDVTGQKNAVSKPNGTVRLSLLLNWPLGGTREADR
jgi:hypothetical protein